MGEVPICFSGRTCRGREQHLSSAEGELLACIYALQKKGNRETIIIAVDDCSKLVILGVLSNLSSNAVSQWFADRILGPYGAPDLVRTDNGKEFEGKFTELLRTLGIEHRLTRTHSPWTNGRAERTVRTVKSMIRRFMANNP